MGTIKSYTDISQAKKLAEILPIGSADMRFCFSHTLGGRITGHYPMIGREPSMGTIPCWSLEALLEILDFPLMTQEKKQNKLEFCLLYYNNYEYIEITEANPVDACYEMILKLHEQKLL